MSKRIIKGLKKRYPKQRFEFVASDFQGKIWNALIVNGEVTPVGYAGPDSNYEQDNDVYKMAVQYLETMKGLADDR